MSKIVFLIESNNSLSNNDFKYLRYLYLPITGPNSIIIYEYFFELSNDYEQKFFDLELICKKLKMDQIIFQDAIDKLEAVGLINTLKKKNENIYLYSLIKPNNIYSFNKNPILKNHLIKEIGNKEYERIYLKEQNIFINKSNYDNISKKYQDIFPIDFNENLNNNENEKKLYSTLDLEVNYYKNHEDNITKLHASDFIKYITKRNPTSYDNQLINSLLKLGYLDSVINLLIDFSLEINNNIVHSYILKIAHDFKNRSIQTYSEIKSELINVSLFKKNRINKGIKKENLFNKFEENIISKDNLNSDINLTLDEIFNEEDIKGMF